MAELVPLKAVYDGSSICGLSELRDGDVVGVEHGGLGVCTIPSNTLLIGNGQGAISTTSALTTNGQIIIGGTGGPQIANLTGTSNEVEITDGNGAITIGLPATVQISTNLKTPAFSITNEYCLPTADGSAGQIMCTDGSGALSFIDFDGSGHCIAFSGTTVADRTCLNFLGGGVTVSDNSGTNATDITIPVTTPELKVRNTAGCELSIELENTAIGGELVCDTTPQLGGTLDVNGYGITSVSNGNISITPNGSGSVVLDGLSWPQADGTAGYILCTDGSGSLSWATDASGQSVAGSNTQVQFNNSGNFGASSNLTYDGTILKSTGDLCATVKVVAPALCIGSEYVLPTADGSAGQIMCTDGSGALAFATASAGVTLAGSTNNTIATVTGADALCGEANLTFDGTTLAIGNGSAADYLALRLYQGGGTSYYWDFTADVDAGDLIIGGNHSSFDLILNPSYGNVGIGTTTPDGWLANSNARVLAIHNTDTTSGNSATELALSVAHSTSWNAISFTNGAKVSSSAEGKILYDHNSNSMRFSTNASERMRIDSAGKVGIGTVTAASLLHLYAGAAELDIQSTGASEAARIRYRNTQGDYRVGVGARTGGGNFEIKSTSCSHPPGGITMTQVGLVGIGTATPGSVLHVSQTTSGVYTAKFENNQLDGPTVWINHTGTTSTTNPVLAVSGAGTEALQVKSNGAFFLSRQGTGSGASDTGWYMTGAGGTFYGASAGAVQYLSMSNTGTIQGFRYNDTYVGQVSISTSATSYQSASDYRLKENIVDLINATDRVAQLQPRRFNWKADPDVVTDGFIAHEVESIVPEAVDGTKDDRRTIKDVIAAADGTKIEKNVSEEDWEEGKTDTLYTAEDTIPDGKEIGDVKTSAKYPSDSTWEAEREVDWYQSMDNAKLVPVLTAAIQELTVRLEAAEAKITTLEAA